MGGEVFVLKKTYLWTGLPDCVTFENSLLITFKWEITFVLQPSNRQIPHIFTMVYSIYFYTLEILVDSVARLGYF